MSLEVIKQGDILKVLSSTQPIGEGERLSLFTLDEVCRREAEAVWGKVPAASRESMLMQTQSQAYQEWMEEEEWSEKGVREGASSDLLLTDFQA